MKAQLSISGDAHFTLFLTPETDAERDILRRVTESEALTVKDLLKPINSWRTDNDHIKITPMPVTPEKDELRILRAIAEGDVIAKLFHSASDDAKTIESTLRNLQALVLKYPTEQAEQGSGKI